MSEKEASQGTPSAPLHWQVRVCRWLWRALLYLWGTLFVGIVGGTIANINTTTTDTPLTKLFIVHLALTYPLPVWSSVGSLIVFTLIVRLGCRQKQVSPTPPLSAHDRVHMLRRLRVRYEQILAQSLRGAVEIELGLVSKPAAVQNTVNLSLHLADQPERLLPSHTSIVQAYELAQHELLILGEPGAGKSTLLLDLAYSFLQQSEQDAAQPLPILLPLSTWAEHKYPLNDWLCKEIARLYDVPRRLSQQWIEAEQVLPLLDGLDEMEETARPACVAAINAYHRDHLCPLVVCSRSNEYEAATRHERLALHTAVVVQPLDPKQVDDYLSNLGKALTGLRAGIKTNTLLQELATTPLMLQILILVYYGTSARAFPQKRDLLRNQTWTDYIQRMVREKGEPSRYPLAVTTSRLGWIASEMRRHNLAVFSLESLQPDWLPQKQRLFYFLSIVLIFGLAGVLIGWPSSGPIAGLIGGGLIGALFGLLARRNGGKIALVENVSWSWQGLLTGLASGLAAGLLLGGIFGLFIFFAGPIRQLGVALTVGFTLGLSGGMAVGLVRGLVGEFLPKKLTTRPILSPSEGIQRSAKNGLVLGLAGGLIIGSGAGFVAELIRGPMAGLVTGLLFWLACWLVIGLLGGLFAVVQHILLRIWLALGGLFPWQAIPFLEDATARILLRRVGGNYGFAHRLLLDFFADASEKVPSTASTVQPTRSPLS